MLPGRDDYSLIMNALADGDIAQLEEIAQIVDGFPNGKDDFIGRGWIINAIDGGSLAAVEWMIAQGVELNVEDSEGYPTLHSCIDRSKGDKYDILALLLANGADVNQRGYNDWTPLHLAAIRDEFKVIRMLLDAGAGREVRTRIDDYATAEEEARKLGHARSADLIRDWENSACTP